MYVYGVQKSQFIFTPIHISKYVYTYVIQHNYNFESKNVRSFSVNKPSPSGYKSFSTQNSRFLLIYIYILKIYTIIVVTYTLL